MLKSLLWLRRENLNRGHIYIRPSGVVTLGRTVLLAAFLLLTVPAGAVDFDPEQAFPRIS